MTIRIVIDMNLSPLWVDWFTARGWDAVHWSTVGDPRAPDATLMNWARDQGYTVFTHDLDFGAALALTGANGPSVVQVRAQDVLPDHMGRIVQAALTAYDEQLALGALLVVDETNSRVRLLPLTR
jgi:predicted nuclease of predicted toxin-antitoxin system